MSKFTLQDLIDAVEDMRYQAEDAGVSPDEIEVRLAHQPRWAFEYSVDRVDMVNLATPKLTEEQEEYIEEMTVEERSDFFRTFGQSKPETAELVVYIAEGEQIGYLPGIAARSIGWSD